MRGASGIGMGNTIKYLRRTARGAVGSGLGRRRKSGITDLPLHHKRPAFALFYSTTEVRGLGAQCVCVGPELSCCVHYT
jgi:hypothetical protein